jgi:CRISPR/Cas system CSM-associated protein Csm3 (group 7 of RAMP superfamily)
MATLKYKIQFFSDWHCGSGLAAGADVDALVIKDDEGFPFIPGKTIKGLVREAIETIGSADENQIKNSFGFFKDDKEEMVKGQMFFENAELDKNLKATIDNQKTTKFLYRSISSTAIEENGIAKDNSLRRVEVVVPCELEGKIYDVPDTIQDELIKALKFIKRMGVSRNRGLGRCQITVIDNK